jgi:hypothetical protein
MPTYIALTSTAEVDWQQPEYADELAEYAAFEEALTGYFLMDGAARLDDQGRPVLLPDQDRSRWDTATIKEGVELVGTALRRTPDRPDPCVVQAAIAACHALAASLRRHRLGRGHLLVRRAAHRTRHPGRPPQPRPSDRRGQAPSRPRTPCPTAPGSTAGSGR